MSVAKRRYEDRQPIEVTNEILEAAKSIRGGWKRKQFEILGISWPPVKGWKELVIGKHISQDEIELLIRLRQ